jgi:cobyrinic acid a,c-diamide synthase
MPVYAECGGFMYLTEGIYDLENIFYSMAGVFPLKTKMTGKRARLGYREAALLKDSMLGQKGDIVQGHEFHYSDIVDNAEDYKNTCRVEVPSPLFTKTYSVKNGEGTNLDNEGYRARNTLGSYIHIHFGSNPQIADNFLNFIKTVRNPLAG